MASTLHAAGIEVVSAGHLHRLIVGRHVGNGVGVAARGDGQHHVSRVERLRRDVADEILAFVLEAALGGEHARRDEARRGRTRPAR